MSSSYSQGIRVEALLKRGPDALLPLELLAAGDGVDDLEEVFRLAMAFEIPCVLVTGGLEPPRGLTTECERHSVPLLRTDIATPRAISKISRILEDNLAERTVMHGALLDILGLGVLITGESGIGKSESALDTDRAGTPACGG